MKKIGISIAFFITFVIIYILQSNVFINFKIAGVMPNLFVLLILYIGLFANTVQAIGFGIVIGLIIDLTYGKVVRNNSCNVMYCRIFRSIF